MAAKALLDANPNPSPRRDPLCHRGLMT
ncbi:protein of unknown function [Cupriavidus taiwanensis]|nr:protein of unknown function [Cupriavidus taiwanensis]